MDSSLRKRRRNSSQPMRLMALSSEQVILDHLEPQLLQLMVYSVMSARSEQVSQRQLALHLGFCTRMAFDHHAFADKGTFHYTPVSVTGVTPSHSVEGAVVVFNYGNEILDAFDKCSASLRVRTNASPPAEVWEEFSVEFQHVIGNIFTALVPPISQLSADKKEGWRCAELMFHCRGSCSSAVLEVFVGDQDAAKSQLLKLDILPSGAAAMLSAMDGKRNDSTSTSSICNGHGQISPAGGTNGVDHDRVDHDRVDHDHNHLLANGKRDREHKNCNHQDDEDNDEDEVCCRGMRCAEDAAAATSWSAESYPVSVDFPLHVAVWKDDVPSVLLQLDAPCDVEQVDQTGISPATLALIRGNRIVYSLLTWKCFGWPVYAVCQLLRARLELDSSLINSDVFFSLRDAVHELVHHSGPNIKYRPIRYETVEPASWNKRRSVASLLLREIPYTEHTVTGPLAGVSDIHRRGSLDVLLRAIELHDERDQQQQQQSLLFNGLKKM